ncbi:hypothetical protein SUGI_0838740 [Cryptomeria japonica]|nr:hypothetical protein SUGI_0838740 [Cryptomeria japonica]
MADKNRCPSCEVEDGWVYEVEDGWMSKDNFTVADYKLRKPSCDVEDGWMYVGDGGVNKALTVIEVARIKEETNLDGITMKI